MSKMEYELAGLYITDGRIQMALGKNLNPTTPLNKMADFALHCEIQEHEFSINSDSIEDIQETFNAIFEWIIERAPDVNTGVKARVFAAVRSKLDFG